MDAGISQPREIFGIHVFDREAMKERLPEEVYKRLVTAIEGGQKLDSTIADFVAAAMKEWALSKGATHYTHWFQPRTDATAEKHMAFLSLDDDGAPLQTFRGKELIRSEPDASSFPSGGMRSTFEARGYCAWDPSSPAFIVPSHKGGTLCIPSVFLSYDGTPLDIKTPLLKSIDAVNKQAMRLLKAFGNRVVRSVEVTVGAEQEFFLVEEEKARLRPDLTACGRTLIGAPSPKTQPIEAHYFGTIHPRVLAFMEDVERDMYRLGQVIMTRHNEAAPGQFEFAPVLAEGNRGCDQNHLLMEVMKKMARRHRLHLLLHSKPFDGINGSGKHLNFSLRDSEGRNLLKPSSNPRRNVQFLSFLCSFMLGVQRWGGLLVAGIMSAGNMHRLGGHEAPPSVMSVYLGGVVSQVLEHIEKGLPEEIPANVLLDLGMNRLPSVEAHNSDRNRTSPIAFTGNKWEFRGVGAPQAIGAPLTLCLALWAGGLDQFCSMLEARMLEGVDVADAAIDVIRRVCSECAPVHFEGNGYDPSWPEEARRRGLPVCSSPLEGLDQYLLSEHRQLLISQGIMTDREICAYHEIRVEQYVQALTVEMTVLRSMMWEGVLPALSKQIIREHQAFQCIPPELQDQHHHWKDSILHLAELKSSILGALKTLEELLQRCNSLDTTQAAQALTDEGMLLMASIRRMSDTAEGLIAKDLWPYPTYRELLHIEE